MAAVLAILKVAWLVAAFGLVGLMGVHLGRAEAAPTGVATAVVVVPLGFSPLSLFVGCLVFTLVWSIGGPAWFGIPIPMAVLFPVILAACGAMIVRGRGMFG